MDKLYYTSINIDDRCLDLLLTEDEILTAFNRSLDHNNQKFIYTNKCCSCWPVKKPPQCSFWAKAIGLCYECQD